VLFKKNAIPLDAHESTLMSEESVVEPGTGVAYVLIEAVYRITLFVTIGAWAVFGFAVWIPLLVRSTIILARALFHASLFRDAARVTNAQLFVHFAVGFYKRGFEHFLGFYRQRGQREAPNGLFEPLTAMNAKQFVIECGWAVGVWLLAFFVMRVTITAIF
jgi:hypothetical protein